MANGQETATVQETTIATGAKKGLKRSTVTRDKDDTAIAKIGTILAGLDDTSRTRVLGYIADKYGLGR